MASSSNDLSSPPSQPSLDTLVSYVLAAKRSLSSIDHVSRANELVTSSKASFVQQTALKSRTSYLRSGCRALYGHLSQMHAQLGSIASESSAELDEVIKGVTAAERRLQGTLDGLRSTIVDSKLRPKGEEPKSLLDFVDGGVMRGLMDEVADSVQETDKARKHYDGVVDKLGHELLAIEKALVESEQQPPPPPLPVSAEGSRADGIASKGIAGSDDEPSPVPEILQTMEASAHEMAENLESLVKHYDLCLDALRHTEGAGAAFSRAASRNDLPADQNAAIADEIGDGGGDGIDSAGHEFPALGTEDRAHLMSVLASDAGQVEEVVSEIVQTLQSLEAAGERVLGHGVWLAERYGRVRAVYGQLEAAEARLPHYSTQSHLYVVRLDGAKAAVADKQAALQELANFYAGFLAAYDRLVIEVGRRKDVARRMRRIRDDAAARLDQLSREDSEERDLFRRRHGEFLPRDIWPGLSAPPPRYEVALVEGQGSVPDISASVVQRAIRRVSARPDSQKEEK